MNKYVEALLIERRGYEQRGLKHRVAQVDAALREVGYEINEVEAATIEPDSERAVKPRAKKRG